ncbi:hypothetical protein P7C71_g6556, partial [Lecanoromycetidae sp. Uapishka_2]
MTSPPTVSKFLEEIARILRERNGIQLQEYLKYEPPLPALYNQIVSEVKQVYPASSEIAHLENKCKSFIPEYEEGVDDGGSRVSFISFMVKYFNFLRDVDVTNLVETHDQLKALLNQSILALGSSVGLVVLPTVISLSQTLARLAIGLDKRPDLTENLTRRESTAGGDEAAERVTLVESSANVIREAFKKCLGERSGNTSGIDNNEAAGLFEKFEPLCMAIVKGDLASFRRFVDMNSEHADWFIRKRILLQFSNRCEILVWRSLARRTFMISGSQGDTMNKRAPTLALQDVLALAVFLESKLLTPAHDVSKVNGSINGNDKADSLFPTDRQASAETGRNYIDGYVDPDLADVVEPEPPLLPTIEIIESIFASLIEQDLLHGFISHSSHRFAITGVKNAAPIQIGFPRVWDVISARADNEVPGWVRERKGPSTGGSLGGMVVNLSGARPAGAAPT